jgi:WD40 repeat protein
LKNGQGDCVGFLMPEIKDGKELLDVYNPRRRQALKLQIDWRFLHTTALNIVSIIEALHAAGYVLGDIKPQNILVNNRALPSIIDTDSFQVINPKNGKVYNCLVGSEGYTPPELIGKDFDSIEQTEIHDRFRLGVIIYQLLFGGNNPFQGKWTGAGEIPDINELICQGLWVNGSTNLIAAVARTIPLEIVHPEVQQCFLKCFNDGHKNPNFRPTAKKWLEALKVGNDRLTICGRVDNHYYSRTYGKCYWCDRSTNLGVDIFHGVVKAKPSVVVESTIFAATNTLELVKQEGKIITVVGQVANTRHLSSINIFFINFGNVSSLVNGYSPFTIVIFSEGLKNLSNSRSLTITQLSNWVGSYIKITGTLEIHQKSSCNTPQIILKDSSQISLISQTEANNLIAENTNTNTSAAVKQTQSQASQTNQLVNSPRQVSQPVISTPQSQPGTIPAPQTTIPVKNKKPGKLLIAAILGFIGTQFYGCMRYGVFPVNPISVIASLPSGIFLERTLTGHSDSVWSVAYSPDGQTLASGSWDKTIKLWNVKTGNLLQTLTGHSDQVRSVAYSPDGQTLASGSSDKTIKLWNVRTGNLLQTLTGHSDSVWLAYSPDGQTLASGSWDNTIKIWDVKTGNLLQTLTGHSDSVYSVAYSPDGQTLASGSSDNTIKLWNVKTGNLLQTVTGHSHSVRSVAYIAYSPDGQTLASGGWDKTIKLWDINTGNLLQTLTGHSDRVRSVAYSPDGQTLASGSDDNTIKLWNVKTGNLLQTLEGHSDLVFSVAYSPDGQTLASGGYDKTIKIWRLK